MSDATKYAEALVQAALGEWVDQLVSVQRALRRSPDVATTLTDPNSPPTNRESAVTRILPHDAAPQVSKFVRLLVREGDIRLLDEIVRRVQGLVPTLSDDHSVLVTSAHELSTEEREKLEAKLAAEHAGGQAQQVRYEVDPELLGGLRIQIGDRVMDHSVASRLDALRARLIG